MRVADRFIQKHFLTVAQSEEFLNLDVDSVISILSKDELFVDNEEQVFEISMKWLQHDLPNRAIHSHKYGFLEKKGIPFFLTQLFFSHVMTLRSSPG
jgi:hypothetical protein